MSKEKKVQILEEDPGDFDLSFKLIVIGDSAVGKSCLSIKATKGIYDQNYNPTIGFEFLTFFVKVDESNIKLQIWDTCGQEVYRSLISSFYHNSSLAVLVYAINNKNSFMSLESWLNEIKTLGSPDINIFLIGNKADLEEKRQIPKEMGEEFCKNHGIQFFLETSAKTGFNAQNVFLEAAKLLYEQHLQYKDRLSRPNSVDNLIILDNRNTENVIIESNEEDEEDGEKTRKKKCCL
jgi:small GTP-binding protein